jgi:NADPH2:quinone reductase
MSSGMMRPVVHQVFGPQQAAAAHALMESNQHIGKLLIDWQH